MRCELKCSLNIVLTMTWQPQPCPTFVMTSFHAPFLSVTPCVPTVTSPDLSTLNSRVTRSLRRRDFRKDNGKSRERFQPEDKILYRKVETIVWPPSLFLSLSLILLLVMHRRIYSFVERLFLPDDRLYLLFCSLSLLAHRSCLSFPNLCGCWEVRC